MLLQEVFGYGLFRLSIRARRILSRHGLPRTEKIDQIDLKMNVLTAGLSDWMFFKPGYVQKVACRDEVDLEIITRLYQAGDGGILPSNIAEDLSRYGMRRWDVTRRIQRMNKRLKKELGKLMAEKRGHRWALTSFMFDAWGSLSKSDYARDTDFLKASRLGFSICCGDIPPKILFSIRST